MIVVTGATGNVGRPLVRSLADAGEQVTAVARRVGEVPAGVRPHRADLAEPDSLKPALHRAAALFLLTSADFMARGSISDVMNVVRDAGVRRVVLLSSQGVGAQRHSPGLEDAVKRSGVGWTMLRPGNFDSDAFQWARSVRTRRLVAAPFGDVALPAVDPADIAEVAAVALREPGHEGATYTLTGPTPISPREQADEIGRALGEPVRFAEQGRAEARSQLLGFMPEPVVEVTLGILGAPSDAERRVSPDAERLLGRPPRAFGEWAARNVAAFR